jgi:uncharacterized protein (DUF736 family)
MAQIGTFTRGDEGGAFTGTICTLNITVKAPPIPVTLVRRDNGEHKLILPR